MRAAGSRLAPHPIALLGLALLVAPAAAEAQLGGWATRSAIRAQLDLGPCAVPASEACLEAALAGDPRVVCVSEGRVPVPPSRPPVVPIGAGPGSGLFLPPALVEQLGGLTPAEQALFGCGPFWGTSCEVDGVDLSNVDESALVTSWLWISQFQGGFFPAGVSDPWECRFDEGLPSNGCPLLSNETAFLSANVLLFLVAMSTGPTTGSDAPESVFDPEDPEALDRCSFARPELCSTVAAFFGPPRATTRPGGNSSFGRRDFVWWGPPPPTPPPPPLVGAKVRPAGCLPEPRAGSLQALTRNARGMPVHKSRGRCAAD